MENNTRLEKVDFHVHYDDEIATRIIDDAKKNNVVAVALIRRTEVSDNIGKYIEYGKQQEIEVIPGVEYMVRLGEDNLVDLVAIGFDHENPKIKELFGVSERKEFNRQIALQQKALFEERGFDFTNLVAEDAILLERLMSGEISEKAIVFCKLVARNPQNRALIDEIKEENKQEWEKFYREFNRKPGYEGDTQALEAKFIWRLFCAFGKSFYIPVQQKAEIIIESVHEAGGVVLYSPEKKHNEDVWKRLKNLGIDGIMGWHGGRLEIDRKVIKDARSKDLLILGGSDYDPNVDEWRIGEGSGVMYISTRRLRELKDYIRNKYSPG